MAGDRFRRGVALLGLAGLVAACSEGGGLGGLLSGAATDAAGGTAPATSVRLVEREVEAPDVFQVAEEGLWDGRPSLGGVWVAHPDVGDPERVIIRNTENGNFVIGALFRRERDMPGPLLQVSSDAASALGMLAGAPTGLNVTALRRQEVAEEAPAATEIAAATPATPPADAEAAAEAPPAAPADPGPAVRPVDGVATVVTSALDAAEADAATPAPQPAAAPRGFGADRPFLQIGLFSVEANAGRAADMLRASGIVPSTLKEDYQGKVFWRVVVGPITGRAERAALLDRARGVGFADAYFVAN